MLDGSTAIAQGFRRSALPDRPNSPGVSIAQKLSIRLDHADQA
jgi:hypothetical protein